MFCSQCGKEFQGSFCPKCGQAVITTDKSNDNAYESQTVTKITKQEYVLAAGKMALNGERQEITQIEIEGDSVTLTNYMKTTQMPPLGINHFNRQEIASISFKKTTIVNTIAKVRYVAAVLISIFPPFVLGLFLAAFTYWITLCPTMIIQLKNGTKLKAYYILKSDTDAVYAALLR